jgi:hypothetical protein
MVKPTGRYLAKCFAAIGLAMLMVAGALAAPGASDAPATAPATSPAATLTEHDLALLHQLESGSWKERKAAEAELSALPLENEPIIQAMLDATKSPETATRLDPVLRHMKDTKTVGATLITMKMTDAPAKAVYAELFGQAGGALRTDPPNLLDDPALPKLSVDVDHQSFWTVIEKLQQTSKLTLVPESDSVGGCHLARGGATVAEPHDISGPFFITIGQSELGVGTDGVLSVTLRVYPEPKLRSVLNINVAVNQAVDDKGNLLVQGPPIPVMFFGGQKAVAIVRFKPGDSKPGARLARFSAMVTPEVIFHSEHLDVGDLTKAAPQTIQAGVLAVKFEGCKKTGETYQLKFSTGPDPQMTIMQIFQQHNTQLRVLDAAGHELTPVTSGFSGGGTGGNVAVFAFAAQPEPNRLICNVPTDIRNVDGPVDFKDLSIPLIAR